MKTKGPQEQSRPVIKTKIVGPGPVISSRPAVKAAPSAAPGTSMSNNADQDYESFLAELGEIGALGGGEGGQS